MRLSAVLKRGSAGYFFGSAGLCGALRVTILAPRGSAGVCGGPPVDCIILEISKIYENSIFETFLTSDNFFFDFLKFKIYLCFIYKGGT